jgi:hypothetical protein
MLTTTDGTLQKIVNGALSMMLTNAKHRIQTFVQREMLTGNRRNIQSKVRNELIDLLLGFKKDY